MTSSSLSGEQKLSRREGQVPLASWISDASLFWHFIGERTALKIEGRPSVAELSEQIGTQLRSDISFRSNYFLDNQVCNLGLVAGLVQNALDGALKFEKRPYMAPDFLELSVARNKAYLAFVEEEHARRAAAVWRCRCFFDEVLADRKPDPAVLFENLKSLGIELDAETKSSIVKRASQTNAEQGTPVPVPTQPRL